jgi:hypothetical protein
MSIKRLTPLQAIRLKCRDCTAGQTKEISACLSTDCSLWVYRLGKHAYRRENRNNPLLRPENFEGLHNLNASEVVLLLRARAQTMKSYDEVHKNEYTG